MKKFINIDATAEEQEAQIKNWIKNNIWQIIFGIAIGFSGIWAWNFYQDYKEQKQIEAKSLYLEFSTNINNLDSYENLLDNYSKSNYTKSAQLLMVKKMFNEGDYDSAIKLITPLTDDEDENIQTIAIFRLANIYLQTKNYQQALSTLDSLINDNYLGISSNIKGDIYFNKGDLEKAKEYYKLAINNAQDNSFAQLIQIKLNDLN